MTGHEASSDELLHYLVVPLRRWRVVALVVVLSMAAVLLYLFTSPRSYTATALVDLHQISTSPFDATKASNQLIDVATEAKTATSQVVAGQAAELLSGHPSTTYLQKQVKVNAATGTTTLSIAFTAPTAAESAAGANAFAKAYLDSRAMWADKRRVELIDTIDQSLDGLRKQLTKVNQAVASADPASAAAQDNLTTRTLLTQQFSDLTQRRNELTGMSLDPGQVVSSALPGSASVSPSRKIFVAGGLLISLILGFSAALARNSLDRRVRSSLQLENLLDAGVATAEHVHRAAAVKAVPNDAMYVLRSRILANLPEQEAEVLLVVDLSDPASTGAVGIQLAQLMTNAGAAVRPILIADTEVPEQHFDQLWLSRSGIRPVWLKVSDPDDVQEQRALKDEISSARQEGQIAVLVMVGRPRRSAIVANSAVANEVVLVAQVGYTRTDTVGQTVQDVLESGASIFAGVLVRRRGFLRRRGGSGKAVNAGHVTGGADPLGLRQTPEPMASRNLSTAPELSRSDLSRSEQGRPEQSRPEQGRPEQGRPEQSRAEGGRPESGRSDSGRDQGWEPNRDADRELNLDAGRNTATADQRTSTSSVSTQQRAVANPPTIPVGLRLNGNRPGNRAGAPGNASTAGPDER